MARYQLRYISFAVANVITFQEKNAIFAEKIYQIIFVVMDSIRQNKVSRLIQRDLSDMFRQECREYALGAMLSVTTVRVSSDLSYARIYVSIFPSDRTEQVLASLEEHNKSIRFALGRKIGKQMRIIPELRFFVDDSLDYIDKIDELLK